MRPPAAPKIRHWENLDDMRMRPEQYIAAIPELLRKVGINPDEHSRALGYILREIDDPKVHAALYNQLSELAGQGPFNDVRNYEGLEKATWMISALALPHDSPARIAGFTTTMGYSSGLIDSAARFSTNTPQELLEHLRRTITVPNLDGLDDHNTRAGISDSSSPTLAYVTGYSLNAARERLESVFDIPENPAAALEEMGKQEDPDLVNAMLDLNRALRDSWLERRFTGEPSGLCSEDPRANSDRKTECALQFATANGARPDLQKETAIPHEKSTLINFLKYGDGNLSTLEIADQIIRIMSGNLTPAIQQNPDPSGGEHFQYPSTPPSHAPNVS